MHAEVTISSTTEEWNRNKVALRDGFFSVPHQQTAWQWGEAYFAVWNRSAHLSRCQNRMRISHLLLLLFYFFPQTNACRYIWQKGGTMSSPACVCPAAGAITLLRFTGQWQSQVKYRQTDRQSSAITTLVPLTKYKPTEHLLTAIVYKDDCCCLSFVRLLFLSIVCLFVCSSFQYFCFFFFLSLLFVLYFFHLFILLSSFIIFLFIFCFSPL